MGWIPLIPRFDFYKESGSVKLIALALFMLPAILIALGFVVRGLP